MASTPKPASRLRFLAVFGHLFPEAEWPPARLEPLLATVVYRSLEAGTVLLREGQTCASVPFVLEGAIRIFKVSESGREIGLYRIEEGQSCILSLGCMAGSPQFPATVVAERPTEAAFLPRQAVDRLFAEGPSFRAFVLGQYSRRMTEVIELVEEVAFRKVDQRLALCLEELAQAQGTDLVATTHQELAALVGTSREVVSRILKDWEQKGALGLGRGSVRITQDFARLVL